MLKKLLCLALAICTLSSAALCGCSQEEAPQPVQSQDKYRNFYEIFVYSFYDSNGDGIGDLNGLTEKLDYLNDGDPTGGDDLGIDGIWLMPIMESGSYHKYDVDDYKKVDSDYGTNDDFKKLCDECHKRGINVIIDLVLNHTSTENPWYTQAVKEISEGNMDGYVKYYDIATADNKTENAAYSQMGSKGGVLVESNFSSEMPELNLSNEDVRAEIKDIMKFWIDLGCDGFRLDAVKFYDSASTDGSEFLEWLYKTAKDIKEDVYMVGEEWSGSSDISMRYRTGIDSLFNFPYSNGGNGTLLTAINSHDVQGLLKKIQGWDSIIKKSNPDAIDAVFLSNHDMPRSALAFSGDLRGEKAGAMIYLTMPGNPFIYYGEEVGIMGGSSNDGTYRSSMPWSYEDTKGRCEETPGVADNTFEEYSPEQSVEEQIADPNSLFNFYKKVIDVKLKFPSIARGEMTDLVETNFGSVSGYVSEYNGEKIMLVYNMSEDEHTVDIPKDSLNYSSIVEQLCAQDCDSEGKTPQATLDGTSLTMPGSSFVILK